MTTHRDSYFLGLGAVVVAVGLGLTSPAGAQDAATPSAQGAETMPAPALSETQPVAPSAEATTPENTTSENPPEALPAPASGESVQTALPHDLSPIGMFRTAHIVVKAVMIGLILASLATWTILVAKSLELAGAKTRARRTLRAIREARTLDEAISKNGKRRGPAAAMLAVAQNEAELSDAAIDAAGGEGLKERVAAALGRIEAGAGRRMAVGTGLLATIGSIAPFVGLFGTVWGIMNSFIGISESKTTNLAVVAPGIAEALLATAIGLVAAIPAVVIYNHFARATARYRALLADAAAGVSILVSRDLDFRVARPQQRLSRAAAE